MRIDMKIWKLTPVQGKGYVRIRADSEIRAREIAYREFANTKVNKMVHTPDWSSLPWKDPNHVTCRYENEDMSGTEGIMDIV
jgi:hypothetical protein